MSLTPLFLLKVLSKDLCQGIPSAPFVVIWTFTSTSSQGSCSFFPELVSHAVAPAKCLS